MTKLRLPEKHTSLKILHLGDSYTCAEGIELSDGWCHHLQTELKAQGWTIEHQDILAKNGWTVEDLGTALKEHLLSFFPNYITLCIGVNNQYRGVSSQTFERGMVDFLEYLLSRFSFNKPPLTLFSIPDWSASPYAVDRDQVKISKEINTYNLILKDLAHRYDLGFIDWTELTRQFRGKEHYFASDGLHPNGKQYRRWIDEVLTAKN